MTLDLFRKTSVAVFLLAIGTHAKAKTLTVPIVVIGSIAATPEWEEVVKFKAPFLSVSKTSDWQNVLNAKLSSFKFDFTGLAATVANIDVDSAVITAKLIHISGLTSVILHTPNNCLIGGLPLANTDVKLIVGNTVVSDSGSFTMANNVSQPLKLRFISEGMYGLSTGVVFCSGAGSLDYNY